MALRTSRWGSLVPWASTSVRGSRICATGDCTCRLALPPDGLLPVVDRDVWLETIEGIWDDFVRVAASVQCGHCTAVQALTRFGSAARGQPLYDGGVAQGRLFRTIFLIDYFTMPTFRAELQHVLNRGEALHAV